EPFSNWGASLGEDAAVPAGLWLALANPWLFLASLAAFALAAIFFIGWVVRGLSVVFRKYRVPLRAHRGRVPRDLRGRHARIAGAVEAQRMLQPAELPIGVLIFLREACIDQAQFSGNSQ